ncbi:MAG: thioredoxin [Candidatus Bathyarchaeia archaeon]
MGEEDKELERIKRSKFKDLIRRTSRRNEGLSVKDKPVDLTDSTFGEFVQGHSLAVVDCWAPWCGPCHMVSPIVEELAREYAGKIAFGKLNVDNNRRVPMQYGIMGIPTLLVFKNGELVDRIIGAMPKATMERMITSHL